MSKVDARCCCCKSELSVTTAPLYEYWHLWAEEGGRLRNNSAQWSYGNGSTGFMGLPVAGEGWELINIGFMADTYPAQAVVEVAVCDYLIAPSSAASNILASITVNGSTDGFGDTGNAAKTIILDPPVPVNPQAIIGFRTIGVTGNVSDARVVATLRRKVGEYVSAVSLV